MRLCDRQTVGRFALPMLALTLALSAGCHGETNWAPLASQQIYVADRFYDIALLGPEKAMVLGYNGKVLSTEDSGMTWTRIDAGSDQALYSIDMVDDNIGWIVGQAATIQRTTDGGKTWTSQGGDVYMTDDCRETHGEDEECALAPLFAISAVDAMTAYAIGDRSTVATTKDGGESWQSYTLKNDELEGMDLNSLLAFEDPVLYDIHFFDAQTGFVVGEFGKIFQTTDGGESWQEKQATLVGDLYFDVMELPTFFDIEFLDRNRGFAVGLDGRVAATTDGGESWDWAEHGVEGFDSPFYSSEILPNGNVWVVGASGQVLQGDANGKFRQGSFGTQVNNWIRAVRFYDNKNGWVIGGFGFIMNTTDGGETWFQRIG